MHDLSQLKEIARELRRLLATSPTDNSLLPGWYDDSRSFAERLNTEFVAVDLPEEVWHFLHDADTRAKDPQFRATQARVIADVIRDLEQGVVPEPRGSVVAVDSRWLVLIVFAVAAAIAAWVAL